jgi:hypothetical protein
MGFARRGAISAMEPFTGLPVKEALINYHFKTPFDRVLNGFPMVRSRIAQLLVLLIEGLNGRD